MRITDKIFGWLLLLSSLLHGWGSWMHYHAQPEMLLWAEGAGLAGMLVAALNLMRANRPQDRTLAWVSLLGCLGWLALAVDFGRLVGSLLDFRAAIHIVLALVLAAMSLRTALGVGRVESHA